MVTLEDVKKMKVQELRDELEARNMPTTGLKAELLERLEEALAGGAENGEGATPEGAPAAEAEAPVVDEVGEEPAVAEEPAPAEAVAVETDADVVDAEEPAAPEVPQPTEGALAAPDVPAVVNTPAAEQEEQFDAVAAAQAQAQAIAAKFAQQQAAGEGGAGGEDFGNNKRKFEDEPAADTAGEEEHMRKRTSFSGPEGFNGGSNFPDAPTGFSDAAPAGNPGLADPANGGVPSSMAAAGQFFDVIDIPAPMVGKLIGKGGETIKQLQYSTGTRVQIDHQTPGEAKKVSIQGSSQEAVEAAKKQVEQIVSMDEGGGAGGASQSVECPQGIVGRIIGRGGETIRALQQASQAHIVVDQNYPEGEPRRVNISGRPDAVERAVKMVSELISGEPGSAQSIIQKYGAGVTREVQCPKGMVGRVIGKGGETIKALQKNFGANIQIDQTIDPMKITIAGQPAAVDSAAAAVTEIINGGNPYLGPTAGAGYGDAAGGARQGYGAAGGYGAPAAYGAAGFGYGGYPAQAAPQAYGGYSPYGYAQPYGAAQAGYGGYGGYGSDPYAAAGGAGYGGYGGAAGGAAAGGAGGSGTWQELHDDQGRAYYYNTTTGASQWEKPADFA